MSHSKEPWRVEQVHPGEFNIYHGEEIVVGDEGLYSETNPLAEEDARRIVACVNALEGVPTEEIEKRGDFFSSAYRINVVFKKAKKAIENDGGKW